MIEDTLNEETETAEEVIKSIPLSYDELYLEKEVQLEQDDDGEKVVKVLSKETLVNVLDKQWTFNGVPKLKTLYRTLRAEAIEATDFDEYRKIFDAFDNALEERVSYNLRLLLTVMNLNKH